MDSNTLGYNKTFAIKKADGTPFHDLYLRKSTVESIVMSLGDKISGDVYYKDNALTVTMQEYIEYDGIKYSLVNPPTIVREGMASDNSELKGMTKYSFVFYHPMYMLGNFHFTDVAVTQSEGKYLSQNKTFTWVGTLFDMIDKLNANLANTEWLVGNSIPHFEQDGTTVTSQWQKASKLCDPISFDKQYVSNVLKTSYDTWEIPFVITSINQTVNGVQKKYLIQFGLPTQEIYDTDGVTPFVFKFGQGVGLKNNSRTPRNNKIVTRLSGCGAERNVPYGYPQIIWTGNQEWEYTINNDSTAANSYPIYDGVVGGQPVKLIKHPFTRKNLMPTVYVESVNKKVNPLATGYDPETVIIDYHDAPSGYPNPVNPVAPSCETHQFDDVYPRLGDARIVSVLPYDDRKYIPFGDFETIISSLKNSSVNDKEKDALDACLAYVENETAADTVVSNDGGSYTYKFEIKYNVYEDGVWYGVKYVSDKANFYYNVYIGTNSPEEYVVWDDSIDGNGNYNQSHFMLTLPQLSFDIYACAAVTEEMKINMRSGACIGCTFAVQVDWDDYKKNFYHEDGTFDPVPHTQANDGHVRDITKYPNSANGQITVIVQKDNETFGTLMPNVYQKPKGETSTGADDGDKFVVLGISLPQSYVDAAQLELDGTIDEYILENNVYYFDYPLKFDEFFLVKNQNILSQIKNNSIVRFEYAGDENTLYIKQIVIKYGDNPLPQYDITLTDDVEIVLNQIGQVTDDVSRMRVQINELQKYYSGDLLMEIANRLSRVVDDVCQGRITFQKGLYSVGQAIFGDEIRSNNYSEGLYTGSGWRVDQLGNAEFESAKVRSFLQVIQLLVNRQQAQEGDTVYTDNDQIDKVEEKTYNNTTYYKLSLKEKWGGYVTSQEENNIVRGIINTLAAQQSNVSDVTGSQSVETDGDNKYYTSWMKVINPSSVGDVCDTNQICVILYGDNDTPARKNFKPCELMTIARWGCDADPDAAGLTVAEKESIIRRQRLFAISTTDGRFMKLRGVRRPILEAPNYGTTLGEVPSFVNTWSIASRLIAGRDYLYAQGVIVGDFIKVDSLGNPLTNYVDCGAWQNNTAYYHEAYNPTNLQWETSDVWHNGSYWRCKVSQPYQGTYYEPTDANVLYWEKILTSGESPAIATVSVDKINVLCNDNGTVSASITQDVQFNLKVGSSSATQVSVTSPSTLPTGVSITGLHSNSVRIVIDTTAQASSLGAGLTFTVTGTHNGTQYSATITVALICSLRGIRGNVGRFYYYGGEFDATDTRKTFIINDVQTPYFSHGKNPATGLLNCHVFNPVTNPATALTMADMWDASDSSWNNAPWEVFTNDFLYLMSKVIFSDNAYLGSFIVSGDWIISQNGKINGVPSNHFEKFYPEFVLGCRFCANEDVESTSKTYGSVFLYANKTYNIEVSAATFSSSGASVIVDVMLNGSVVETTTLTSANASDTISIEASASGTYSIVARTGSANDTAKLTAYIDCFEPNIAIDGLTGKSYQNDTYIRGHVEATSGEFSGTIKAGNTTIEGNLDLTDTNNGMTVYDGDSAPRINLQPKSVGSITALANDTYEYSTLGKTGSASQYEATTQEKSFTLSEHEVLDIDRFKVSLSSSNGSESHIPSQSNTYLTITVTKPDNTTETFDVIAQYDSNSYAFVNYTSKVRFTAKSAGTHSVKITARNSGSWPSGDTNISLNVNARYQTSKDTQTYIAKDGLYAHAGANKMVWASEGELQFRYGFNGIKWNDADQLGNSGMDVIAGTNGTIPNLKPTWLPFYNYIPTFKVGTGVTPYLFTSQYINNISETKYGFKIDPYRDRGICIVDSGYVDDNFNQQPSWVILPPSTFTDSNGDVVSLPVGYQITIINSSSTNIFVVPDSSVNHGAVIVDANRNNNYYCSLNGTQSRDTYIFVGVWAGLGDTWIAMHDTQ